MMLADHKIATAIGSLGAVVVLGHIMLGPNVVPAAVGLVGAAVAAAAGLYLAIVRRRGRGRPAASSGGRE
jgi:drug/metabolite transporter (DMT)-like permease